VKSREHHIRVARTARYHTLGDPGPAVRELWLVCHGYRQLAGRFIRRFSGIADGSRVIVAPEGLSRFYVDPEERAHGPEDSVGATWMTREDRDSEIQDYVAYLDQVHDAVMADLDGVAPSVVVLGFSQGVHTVSRWVTLGKVRPASLILWGAYPPRDLPPAEAAQRLGSTRLLLVAGTSDRYWDEPSREGEEARLEALGVSYRTRMFEGGHEIDGKVLRDIAAEVSAT
jgi:predicted esterase